MRRFKRARTAKSQTEDDDDEEEETKNDLVEPVVYRGGKMTAAGRNSIYKHHQLPGIGRKNIKSEEEKATKAVCVYHLIPFLC